MFRCGGHEDLMNGMFKTLSMTDLRDRSSYHKGIVDQSYSCRTKNMINKVCKHPLTIPVYSPLQELCFVRTAISSSPRMEWSMRGCLRREDFRLHTDCKHHDQTVLTISSYKPFSMLFGRIERHWEGFEKKPRKIESDHLAASPRKFFIPQHSLHTQTCKNLHTGMIRECFNFQGMLTTCQSLASLI